jgi:hypothetical protein
MIPYFEGPHVDTLINFLIACEPGDFVDPNLANTQRQVLAGRMEIFRSSALQVLYNQMTICTIFFNWTFSNSETASPVVELVRAYGTGTGGAFRALLTFLKSNEETTRLLALKMIGIFLNGNKTSTAYFNSNSGFDMISLLLAPFPVTLHTLQVPARNFRKIMFFLSISHIRGFVKFKLVRLRLLFYF